MAGFDRVEAVFGQRGIERSGQGEGGIGASFGVLPTLSIVVLAKEVELVEGGGNVAALVRKVREGSDAARAELTAATLCLPLGGVVELEPTISVGERRRVPDFRVSLGGERWCYVEVTQPNQSDAEVAVRVVLAALADPLDEVVCPYAVEVKLLLRHDPLQPRVLQLFPPVGAPFVGWRLRERCEVS